MGVGLGVELPVEVSVELPQAGVISNDKSRAEAFCEEVMEPFCTLLPLHSTERYNNGLRKHD